MESEHKFYSIVIISMAVVLLGLVSSIPSCNRDNNLLYQKMTDKGCAYFGDNKFDCRGSK